MEPLKLSFEFDTNDWMAFQEYHLDHSPRMRRFKLIAAFTPMVVASVVLAINVSRSGVHWPTVAILVSFGTLWAIFYPRRLRQRIMKQARVTIESPQNKAILGEHSYDFSDAGVGVSMPEMEDQHHWPSFAKYVETPTHYFLFNTAASAIILPKQKAGISGDTKRKLDQILKAQIAEHNILTGR